MKIEIRNSSNVYIDVTPYLITSQIKWSKKDKSGQNAMEMQDGTYYRDRNATKEQWELPCKALTTAQLQLILSLIQPEYFYMRVTPNPLTGATKVGTFYVETMPANYQVKRQNGIEYWGGIVFSPIEQ